MNLILNTLEDYIQPTRNFSLSYIILDSVFVIFFVTLLFLKKERLCALFSLFGGILYFLVDYLIFYLLTSSRVISFSSDNINFIECSNMETALVLLWMSMSYGILDFAFIWLWLSKNKNALNYSLLIVIWWITCPLISSFINNISSSTLYIMTTRTTNKYHGIMGLIMVIGYFILLLINIFNKKGEKIPIVRLFIIGFMAQFLWEFLLLIGGIRSQNYDNDFTRIFTTMIQNSLVETNLGMPYLYLIHKFIKSKINEDLNLKKEENI